MLAQRTLSNSIKASGIGLHSDNPITLILKPAPSNTGIILRKIDLDPVVKIKARAENVGDTTLSTSLTYKDDKEDGLFTEWYENGQKIREVTYKNEKKDGLSTYWYENGQKMWEHTFKDGEEIEATYWDEDGNER